MKPSDHKATGLEDDILEKIVCDHLPAFSDRIHFSLVCKSWSSLALHRPRQRLPGLLSRLPDKAEIYEFLPFSVMGISHCNCSHFGRYPGCGGKTSTKPLDSVTSYRANQRSIEMLPRLKLPIPHYSRTKYQWYEIDKKEEKHFVAGLDGWLLIADPCKTSASGPQCLQLQLFNPITSATIALPDRPPTLAKLLSSRDDIIQAVLSSSPDNVHVDCNVIVLLELSPYLAWCKVLGEGRGWKFLSNEIFGTRPEEVSYYGETLYARDSKSVYVVRDLIVTSSHRKFSVRAVSLSSLPVTKYPIYKSHYRLAPDLAGQLLIIYDSGISVYKLVASSSSSSDYKWEKVKSLDGYAVFFGTHQSFCLPASDDSNNRVIANRIYYPRKVVNRDFGCSASFVDPYNGLIKRSSFWFLPMNRDVIGEHMESEKGVSKRNCEAEVFSYWTWTDSKVCDGNRFQALLSIQDDE